MDADVGARPAGPPAPHLRQVRGAVAAALAAVAPWDQRTLAALLHREHGPAHGRIAERGLGQFVSLGGAVLPGSIERGTVGWLITPTVDRGAVPPKGAAFAFHGQISGST